MHILFSPFVILSLVYVSMHFLTLSFFWRNHFLVCWVLFLLFQHVCRELLQFSLCQLHWPRDSVLHFNLMPSTFVQIPNPVVQQWAKNMPHLHPAKGHSLEMHHTKWNLISCQKLCGRLSHLSPSHRQQQWQQHHNTSCSTLDDIRDSPACFYGFSPYAWNLAATVTAFLISSSLEINIRFFTNIVWLTLPASKTTDNSHWNKILYFFCIDWFLSSPLGDTLFMSCECSKKCLTRDQPPLFDDMWIL